MKAWKTITVLALLLAALFGWATFVWPTPWIYYQQFGFNLRVNRFTGEAEQLTTDGWRHVTGPLPQK